MTTNLLSKETSPYLLQHQDNPVAWMAWGDQAFARARAENKPILLSIGYAACHWCHVMAHESFEDLEVARVMNELFVNVKVDREERPDVDRIYMTALQAMGEQGGWPLTMFLTPRGEPFWGGTYFPKTPRYGRPGFIQILNRISEIYHDEHDKVTQNAAAISEALNATARTETAAKPLDFHRLNEIAGRVLSLIDFSHGGIRGAPKFPHVPIFEFLWRAWLRTGRQDYRRAVTHTLASICQGGIYDHLGGGFARYTVDDRWLVPHFEKMLYDNAQLVRLMTLVWQETRDPLLEQRVRETIGWVMREMMAEGGAFAASLDADSEGEEGKFYVWTQDEILDVLGPEDAAMFGAIYGVTQGGNFEGKTILNRLAKLELEDEAAEIRLDRARERLLARRDTRIRPGFDDKVLSDWNGLMISAMAWASLVFNEPQWLDAASGAFAFIRDEMWIDGRLKQSARAGQVQHHAIADGYANMISAALALFQVTGTGDYLDQAITWYKEMEAHYWSKKRRGYTHAADDVPHLIAQTFTAIDDATPNANGTMVHNAAALASLTGQKRYGQRADRLLATFTGDALANSFAHGTLLNGFENQARPIEAVLSGDPMSSEWRALIDGLNRYSLPGLTLLLAPSGGEGKKANTRVPKGHSAHGNLNGEAPASLLVCHDRACSLPIETPDMITPGLFGRR